MDLELSGRILDGFYYPVKVSVQCGRNLVAVSIKDKGSVVIDEDDYNAIKEIHSPTSWFGEKEVDSDWHIEFDKIRYEGGREMIHSLLKGPCDARLETRFEMDKKKRVVLLEMKGNYSFSPGSDYRVSDDFRGRDFIPNQILRLEALETLYLSIRFIRRIPDDILRLKNLEELTVQGRGKYYDGMRMSDFPSNLGELKLKVLGLSHNNIQQVPISFGNLSCLEELVLSYNHFLDSLPETIWNLSALRTLNLKKTKIQSLSPSIENMRRLERLDLSNLSMLQSVPNEFWSLTSLRELIWKNCLVIKDISSIGRLSNLEVLVLTINECYRDGLGDTERNCNDLVKEFGKLTKLEKLTFGWNSRHRPTILFPSSMENLKKLSLLSLEECFWTYDLPSNIEVLGKLSNLMILRAEIGQESASKLIQMCPLLGAVHDQPNSYALLCNRFRCQSPFSKGRPPFFHKLWPNLLSNAISIFRPFSVEFEWYEDELLYEKECPAIEPHEAVYKILLDGRQPFVQMLIRGRD